MIRQANMADIPALETFLRANINGAMFPLSNLRTHGLVVEGQTGAPKLAMSFWLAFEGNDIVAAVGLTEGGNLMPVFSKPVDVDWKPAVVGRFLSGAIGSTDARRAVIANLGVAGAPTHFDQDEPQYELPLGHIKGDALGDLVPIDDTMVDLITAWRTAYHIETFGTSPADAPNIAAKEIVQYRARDSHRVLFRDGAPVSITGFNAEVDDVVQIGGVYTPPALRGRHYARTALALHLNEVRGRGITKAVLCAANENAARAYEAIGFKRVGSFTYTIFKDPVEVTS